MATDPTIRGFWEEYDMLNAETLRKRRERELQFKHNAAAMLHAANDVSNMAELEVSRPGSCPNDSIVQRVTDVIWYANQILRGAGISSETRSDLNKALMKLRNPQSGLR